MAEYEDFQSKCSTFLRNFANYPNILHPQSPGKFSMGGFQQNIQKNVQSKNYTNNSRKSETTKVYQQNCIENFTETTTDMSSNTLVNKKILEFSTNCQSQMKKAGSKILRNFGGSSTKLSSSSNSTITKKHSRSTSAGVVVVVEKLNTNIFNCIFN